MAENSAFFSHLCQGMGLALGALIMIDEKQKAPIEETSHEEVPQLPLELEEEDYNLPFTD
jgi:hypothetical protein